MMEHGKSSDEMIRTFWKDVLARLLTLNCHTVRVGWRVEWCGGWRGGWRFGCFGAELDTGRGVPCSRRFTAGCYCVCEGVCGTSNLYCVIVRIAISQRAIHVTQLLIPPLPSLFSPPRLPPLSPPSPSPLFSHIGVCRERSCFRCRVLPRHSLRLPRNAHETRVSEYRIHIPV